MWLLVISGTDSLELRQLSVRGSDGNGRVATSRDTGMTNRDLGASHGSDERLRAGASSAKPLESRRD